MSDEMSSMNSNNSDIEVIGPEDLEESPPPQDDVTENGDEQNEEVVEIFSCSYNSFEIQEAAPAAATEEAEDNVETVGEVKEDSAPPAPAAEAANNDDDDDPPIEVMAGQAEAAPAAEVESEAVRPVVTAARPSASLEEVEEDDDEEDDDEEDDDDIDETLTERLIGLTEMFPDFITSGAVKLASGSVSMTKWSYSMSRTVSWVVFSSAALLFFPVMIETERLQMMDMEKAQKNKILLGAGTIHH